MAERRKFRVGLAICAAALLTVAAACGGGSSDNKADAPAPTSPASSTPKTNKAPAKKANKSTKKKAKSASATTTVPKKALFPVPTTAPGAIVVPAVPTGSQITLPPGVGVGEESSGGNNNPQSPGTTVKPFNPDDGIDLSGTPGVTLAQQHAAEQLLRDTIKYLPQFANQATAYARGYRTIGDAGTGDEHMINWSY